MKKTVSLFVALIFICLSSGVVLASDISGAEYQGTVLISNNGTDATGVSTVCSINTTNLIAGGFINSAANNTVIRDHFNQDAPFMPGYTTAGNPWCVYVDTINEYANLEYTLYTGATGGDIRYFPADAGMSVADAAGLEMSNNGTIYVSGYVDVSAGDLKKIAFKQSAVGISIDNDNDGEIAAIVDNATAYNYADQTGSGTWTNTANADDGNQATSATYTYPGNGVWSPYLIETFAKQWIGRLRFDIQSGGGLTTVEVDAYYNGAWNNVYSATPASHVYVVVDLGAFYNVTSMRLRQYNASAGAIATNLYELQHGTTVWTSLSNIASGEHDITATLDTSDLTLDIDGTNNSTSLLGTSIPDNANTWYFSQNSTMPYMETAAIAVNGANVSAWTWEYGATFNDSIGSNDATPTFRTATSDADVTATLLTFTPVSESDAPAYTIDDPIDFIDTANVTMSSEFTTTINATYPGSEVISDIATAGETPVQFMTLIMSLVILLAVSFGLMYFLRNNGTTSIFIQVIVMGVIMGIMSAVGVLDWWLVFMFLVLGVAVAMASGQRSFSGTGITGNNTFGFLAMAFIGMTTINRILEGRFIQASDLSVANDVLVFQPFNLWGWFNIPVPNLGFITEGIPALVQWDYSFFGGNAQILQFMLYSITAVVSFILLVLCFGAIYQMLSRLRI